MDWDNKRKLALRRWDKVRRENEARCSAARLRSAPGDGADNKHPESMEEAVLTPGVITAIAHAHGLL